MTDLKNKLEEVWREEFNKIWSVLRHFWEFPNSDVELAYKHEARKIHREGKLHSYDEIKKLEQELQKTREHLGKAIKSAEFFMSHADCKRDSWACKCSFCRDTESSKNLREARQYFQDKDKQGE